MSEWYKAYMKAKEKEATVIVKHEGLGLGWIALAIFFAALVMKDLVK